MTIDVLLASTIYTHIPQPPQGAYVAMGVCQIVGVALLIAGGTKGKDCFELFRVSTCWWCIACACRACNVRRIAGGDEL